MARGHQAARQGSSLHTINRKSPQAAWSQEPSSLPLLPWGDLHRAPACLPTCLPTERGLSSASAANAGQHRNGQPGTLRRPC